MTLISIRGRTDRGFTAKFHAQAIKNKKACCRQIHFCHEGELFAAARENGVEMASNGRAVDSDHKVLARGCG